MLLIARLAAVLAGLLHIWFFVLETLRTPSHSLALRTPRTKLVPATAEASRRLFPRLGLSDAGPGSEPGSMSYRRGAR
jgi:hypothetical protein